jgi:hypothetical protein
MRRALADRFVEFGLESRQVVRRKRLSCMLFLGFRAYLLATNSRPATARRSRLAIALPGNEHGERTP